MDILSAIEQSNRTRPWLSAVLALAAGAAVPLGFAPFGWRWIPVLSLAMLLLLLQGVEPKRAALRTFVFGLGMFGVGVSWIYNSLHDYGSASVFVAGLFAAGMVVACSLCVLLVGYGYGATAGRATPLLRIVLFAALWTLGEWLRSWLFTGFPWLFLGYAQVGTFLGGYTPLGGVLLAGFLCCVLAGAAGFLLVGARNVRIACLSILLVIPALGWAVSRIEWTEPTGDSVSVALVQGAVAQDLKMGPDRVPISLDRYISLSREYWGYDLLIWPETAIPTRSFRVDDFLNSLDARLERRGSQLLTGIFFHDFERDRYYNSLLLVGAGPRQVYHKQRLVPFGEYMPMRGLLEFINNYIDIPMSDIASGPPMPPIELAGYPAALGICYESAYPGVYRRQLPEAAYMINVSNDAWFGDSLAPHQHLEIAQNRALEAGRYMLRATNDGITAIISPRGRVQKRSRQFTAEVLAGRIEPYRGTTPFIRWGNLPVLLLCGSVVVLAVGLARRRRS